MNIFVLDLDPKICAKYHCDAHLVKMITEHNQILGSIAYSARNIRNKKDVTLEFIRENFKGFPRQLNGIVHPYGMGYINHPCTKWAGESLDNYMWLTELTSEMCKEYTRRYGKKHAGEDINKWYSENHPNLPLIGMTPFAQAMPEDVKNKDVVMSYRNYYKKYKNSFAKWSHSEKPNWWELY